MKKYFIGIGILILVSVYALPVYSMGHGMGGSGMTDNWGSALMDWLQHFQNRDHYNGQSDQDRKQMEALNRKYDEETDDLKEQIQTKERKLEILLNAVDPDIEKLRTLHGEIQGLRSQLAERQRSHDLHVQRTKSRIPKENRNDWSPHSPSGRRNNHGMADGRDMGNTRGSSNHEYRSR